MAKLRVRVVSLLKEAVGSSEVELEVPDNSTLRDALRILFEKYPRLAKLVEELEKRGLSVVYLVNGESGEDDRPVREGDVLTLLPPASGG